MAESVHLPYPWISGLTKKQQQEIWRDFQAVGEVSRLVIVNGCLPGVLDAYPDEQAVAFAIEIPTGTQLLGIDWTLQRPRRWDFE